MIYATKPFCGITCANKYAHRNSKPLPSISIPPCSIRNCRQPSVNADTTQRTASAALLCLHHESNHNRVHTGLNRSVIHFYSDEFNPQTAFLGNFHKCSLSIGGYTFGCSEALFQAAKFIRPEEPLDSQFNQNILKEFSNLNPTKPGADGLGDAAFHKAKLMEKSNPKRAGWIGLNEAIMERILRVKFNQNPLLLNSLMSTGDSELVERSDRDDFWGDGRNRNGQNKLGKLLQMLREEYKRSGRIDCPAYPHEILECKPMKSQASQQIVSNSQQRYNRPVVNPVQTSKSWMAALTVVAVVSIIFIAMKIARS